MWSVIDGAAGNLRRVSGLFIIKIPLKNGLNSKIQKPVGNHMQGGFPEVSNRFLAAPSLIIDGPHCTKE